MVMKAKPKFAIIAKLEGKDPSATPCGPIRGGEGVFLARPKKFANHCS